MGQITATATCSLDYGGVVRLDTLGSGNLTFPVTGQVRVRRDRGRLVLDSCLIGGLLKSSLTTRFGRAARPRLL